MLRLPCLHIPTIVLLEYTSVQSLLNNKIEANYKIYGIRKSNRALVFCLVSNTLL